MRWMPVLAMLIACGDAKVLPDAPAIDTPPADLCATVDSKNAPTLLESCLCVDAGCAQIAPGIQAYRPRWELYSDGATKKRWIYLPPGTQLDTSDMDFWQFPVGTKLWKEFTRDNVRVETRLVARIGAGDTSADWFYVAYVWNAAQDATTAEAFGVPDANGTPHDVPGRADCKTCHDNTQPARVLGFSALQLDFDNPNADELDLAGLVGANQLSAPPAAPTTPGAYFPLPGNTTVEQPALGYLHANCGHCHNPSSKIYMDNGVVMQLRLTVGTLGSLATTPAYATTIGIAGTTGGVDGIKTLVTAGMPDQSQVIKRFESTNDAVRMPDIGTEVMDPVGRTTLRDWITNLQ